MACARRLAPAGPRGIVVGLLLTRLAMFCAQFKQFADPGKERSADLSVRKAGDRRDQLHPRPDMARGAAMWGAVSPTRTIP